MKKSDITVGEFYSYGTAGQYPGDYLNTGRVVRFEGNKAIIASQWNGKDELREVLLRNIICTYAEHRAAKKVRDDLRAQSEKAQDERVVALREAQRYLEDVLPADALPWWAKGQDIAVHNDRSGIRGGSGSLDVIALVKIVKAARA